MNPTFIISATIELDGDTDPEDIAYHRSQVRRTLESLFPDGAIKVVAGRHFYTALSETETRLSPVVSLHPRDAA